MVRLLLRLPFPAKLKLCIKSFRVGYFAVNAIEQRLYVSAITPHMTSMGPGGLGDGYATKAEAIAEMQRIMGKTTGYFADHYAKYLEWAADVWDENFNTLAVGSSDNPNGFGVSTNGFHDESGDGSYFGLEVTISIPSIPPVPGEMTYGGMILIGYWVFDENTYGSAIDPDKPWVVYEDWGLLSIPVVPPYPPAPGPQPPSCG